MQANAKQTQTTEQTIPINKLKPSRYQTRHSAFENDEDLHDLAMSIKTLGLLELPKVRPLAKSLGHFEIITGHRRIRAISRYLGWTEVKCLIEDGLSELETFSLALAENIQRTNLSAYEEGQAYLLCEKLFGLSDEDIAVQIQKSKPMVMLRRQLAADANKYLRFCNDPRITDFFLQNFNLRHRRILRKISDKQSLARAVTLIAEGSPIRQIRSFVEGAKKSERRSEDYPTLSPERRNIGDIDGLRDSILGRIRKFSEQVPDGSRQSFSELEKMVVTLGDEAKAFRDTDLEVIGLDSIKEFSCPVCKGQLEMSRRLNKEKDLVVIRVTAKDRKLAKEPQYVMYPKV